MAQHSARRISKDAAVQDEPEELTLRVGERRGQKAFVDTTRIDRNTWSLPLLDSDESALCQTLHDGVVQEDWESMYNTLRKGTKEVGSKEVGKRTGLLWKLNEKKRAGQLRFHENRKGQVKNRTQGRKHFWEVWAASPG